MNLLRRKFLKTATFVGAAVTVGSGLLVPQRAIGAYAQAAFEAKDVNAALSASMGSDQHSASGDIKLKAPDIAENGAVVPITVSSTMGNIDAISIVATGNAQPLTSTYALTAASSRSFRLVSRWARPPTSSRSSRPTASFIPLPRK